MPQKEDAARALAEYVLEEPEAELRAEGAFFERIRDEDLSTLMEESYARAKSVLPERKYSRVNPVLVVDFRADARVMGRKEFSVSAHHLYLAQKSAEPGQEAQTVQAYLRGALTHETNHLLLRQLGHANHPAQLIEEAFSEGLATIVETTHHDNHAAYLGEARTWFAIAADAERATTPEERREVLERMAASPALQRHGRQFLSRLKKAGLTTIDDESYGRLVREGFVNGNGPIYHLGFLVWQHIAETQGIDGVRRVVAEGPFAFEREYRRFADGQTFYSQEDTSSLCPSRTT